MTIETLERQVKKLQETVDLLVGIVIDGKPYKPGPEECDRVLMELLNGNRKPFDEYVHRGGPLPEIEVKPYKPYVPRKRKG